MVKAITLNTRSVSTDGIADRELSLECYPDLEGVH